MNTDQMKYLIEISKNVSMSAASENLHMTPQALNTAIKKLEEELGFALLNRSYKGTSLTADGEWFVHVANDFFKKIDERQQYHQMKNANAPRTGELDIIINHSGINNNILGQLVCDLFIREPQLTINLHEISKSVVIHKVLESEVAFGFIFQTSFNDVFTEELPANIIFEPLLNGEMVVSTSENSELAKYNTISLKKASQKPFISYYTNPEPQSLIDHFFSDILHTNIQFSSETNFSVYKEKILRGVANSFNVLFETEPSPTNFVKGMKYLHLRENIKVYFGYIYQKGIEWTDNEIFFINELNKMIEKKKQQDIL